MSLFCCYFFLLVSIVEDISLSGLHAQKAQLRENVLNLNQRAGSLGLVGNHSNLLTSGLPQMSMGLAQSPQMPQLVLANGQLSQGIQGAQVLIPTAQGWLTHFCFCSVKLWKSGISQKLFSLFSTNRNNFTDYSDNSRLAAASYKSHDWPLDTSPLDLVTEATSGWK